jgi:hypothetical protein
MGGKQLGFGDYEQSTAKKGLLNKARSTAPQWM